MLGSTCKNRTPPHTYTQTKNTPNNALRGMPGSEKYKKPPVDAAYNPGSRQLSKWARDHSKAVKKVCGGRGERVGR